MTHVSWVGLNSLVTCGRVRERVLRYLCATHSSRRAARSLAVSFAVALVGFATLVMGIANVGPASAQSSSAGILATGNAIVTGFSGAPPPVQIAPGQDPGDLTFIDSNGPSASVFSMQAPGAPPQAQVLAAPIPFTVTAAQVGQVFGVALDSATPPNMYVAATSAYGLPIVVPGPGGAPTRLHQGAPGATFMAGLFGPAAQGGSPGSIWRIDGVSGAVSLFANVTLNGAANSGPALGGLAFDAASDSLFAADRQTGMIHRFNLSGTETGRYDHGVQGLAAASQPQAPYTPSPLDITNPQFSSDNPATWDYAAPGRLIFGLAVQSGRLYYAVAQNLQIWSVGIASNGSFASDARLEVQVPPAQGATEISKITFDNGGVMVLAERAAPTGDYELMALAQAGIGRVLRYAPSPTTPGAWQPVPDQYAIGFPGQMTNANGGVAIGYSYDANGNLDPASCGGFVWSTGEELRNAADPNLAALLASNGTLYLNGLQGNAAELVEPANVPPLLTYFVDYDAQQDDPAARGHMGDIAIPRNCGHATLLFQQLWLTPSIPPASYCPAGQLTATGLCCPAWQQVVNGACSCPGGLPPGPNGQCACSAGSSEQPGIQCCPPNTLGSQCQPICPQGQTDGPSIVACTLGFAPVLNGNGQYATCLSGTAANPPWNPNSPGGGQYGCMPQSPFTNAANCPVGWALAPIPNTGVSVCQPIGACAPQGMINGPNGTCQLACPSGDLPFPTTQCCPNGQTPGPTGICCPAGGVPNPYTGACCPAGSHINPVTGACFTIVLNCPPARQTVTGKCCLPDEVPQPDGSCQKPPSNCNPDTTHYCTPLTGNVICKLGNGVPAGCCPDGSTPDKGYCVTVGSSCGSGSAMVCCPPGQMPNASPSTGKLTGTCGPPPPPPPPGTTGSACVMGYVSLPNGGGCCRLDHVTTAGTCQSTTTVTRGCAIGTAMDLRSRSCEPLSCLSGLTRIAGVCGCPTGEKYDTDSHKCVAACAAGEVRNLFNGKCSTRTATTTAPPPPAPTLLSPSPVPPAPPPAAAGCYAGYTLINGTCILVSKVCPPGEKPGASGCVAVCPPKTEPCQKGQIEGPDCACSACPAGQLTNTGTCCAAGQQPQPNGTCLVPSRSCPPGEQLTSTGACCQPGQIAAPDGACLQAPVTTPTLTTPPNIQGTTPSPLPTPNIRGTGPTIPANPSCTGGEVVNGKCQCPRGEEVLDGRCRPPAGTTTEKPPVGIITKPPLGTTTEKPPVGIIAKPPLGTTTVKPPVGTKTLTPKLNITKPPPPPPKLNAPALKLPAEPEDKAKR